jgi:DHA1 family bicyclomycin/chloramphenicol resistance-like MFS transporter
MSIRPESLRARVQTLLILGTMSGMAPLSVDMYLPATPSLTRDLQAPASTVQLTLTAIFIGLAVGQLITGPLSDTYGRHRPLVIGLAAYAASSLLCAVVPDVWPLIAMRLVQGFSGATALVIGRAMVRDMYSGNTMARYFSLLMLINGLAPIVAPVLGGQLIRVTNWRGVFLVLGAVGMVLALAAAFGLSETLEAGRRRRGGLGESLRSFQALLRQPAFVGYAASAGLGMAAMFAYISGSPFVFESIYGLSPQAFSLVFASNAIGIMAASTANRFLVSRFGTRTMLATGLVAAAVGGVAVLLDVTLQLGLAPLIASLFVVVASVGLIAPNATALALSGNARDAGTASAPIGLAQFGFGAIAAPLAGVGGTHDALPMAIVIAIAAGGGVAVFLALAGRPRTIG